MEIRAFPLQNHLATELQTRDYSTPALQKPFFALRLSGLILEAAEHVWHPPCSTHTKGIHSLSK